VQTASGQPDIAQPAVMTSGPLPTVAADGSSAPAPSVAAETPHDFDTLVSRLAEAREAAAPHIVRTAFEHAEFGRVAMQLNHDDNGLSVTLASRDPEFSGAVQAAAASVASGSAGNNPGANTDHQRQDNPSQQQSASSQNGAQIPTSFAGQGQGQARSDGSGQQRRDGSGAGRQQGEQRSDTPARSRDDRGQGGVYA